MDQRQPRTTPTANVGYLPMANDLVAGEVATERLNLRDATIRDRHLKPQNAGASGNMRSGFAGLPTGPASLTSKHYILCAVQYPEHRAVPE
jgi:hypothetical protein